MFRSCLVRTFALELSVTAALTTAPAAAQAPGEPIGLPLAPPSPESSNPLYERTPEARPPASAAFTLLGLFVGPLAFALGGATATSAPGNVGVPFSPPPRLLPLGPGIEQSPTGAAE